MTTLIVIDMQNDFITGPLGTPEAVKILPRVREKIAQYQRLEEPIVFTRDTHYTDYLRTLEGKRLPVKHCIFGTHGLEVESSIAIPPHDAVVYIDKEKFGWDHWYKHWHTAGANMIELVGVCTDICVVSNALILKAQFPNTEIYVDASCCAGTTPEMHKAALQVMKSCHINVINEEVDS